MYSRYFILSIAKIISVILLSLLTQIFHTDYSAAQDNSLKETEKFKIANNRVKKTNIYLDGTKITSVLYDTLGNRIKEENFSNDGTISNVTQFIYNSSGLLTEEINMLDDSTIVNRFIFYYNEAGNKIRTDKFNYENLYDGGILYKYSDSVKPEEVHFLDKEDNITNKYEYKYDSENNLTEMKIYENGTLESIIEFSPDENKRTEKIAEFDSDMKIISSITYEYDSGGNPLYITVRESSDLIYSIEIFIYDDNHLITEKNIDLSGDNTIDTKYFYEYEYY